MTESVTENPNFTTQDLFSPLQFCEVVEEQQQRRQLQQQQQQQQQLHHNGTQHQVPSSSQQQIVSIQNSAPQNSITTVKQENSQQPIALQVIGPVNEKSQSIIGTISSMEFHLSPNAVQLQSVESPIVNFQQQPQIAQQIYQVQLNRAHPIQPMQLSSIQMASPPPVNVSNQPSSVTASNVSTSASPFSPSVVSVTAIKPITTTAAVATQTTPLDSVGIEKIVDSDPEIVFSSVANAGTKKEAKNKSNNTITSTGNLTTTTTTTTTIVNTNNVGNTEMEKKPIPVKRTWRRPWKKKKEREKRQPVKRARKVKRRRVMVTKKSIIHIDPRHGPPIDTSNTVVCRESEDTINQMKQKRQRIKLNRNSGREYVNRLGKVVRARKIGSPCNCPLKCWDRMGSKILEIFNNFWDLCDFNLQNSYLFTCLKLCDVKRRYTKKPADESRRQNTFEYFVRISGKHLRVCKKAFMSSHGLTSDKRLRTLFTQMKDGALIPEPDRRGKHLRPSKSQSVAPPSTHFLTKTTKKSIKTKKRSQATSRFDAAKQAMYAPPTHPHSLVHHCTPPPPPTMQEPPHAYIPNGDIYFPGHYLEPPQSMAAHHMNQIAPSCQKMLESPAYFMAGMKENTFHQ